MILPCFECGIILELKRNEKDTDSCKLGMVLAISLGFPDSARIVTYPVYAQNIIVKEVEENDIYGNS